jgi:hypothetical protein
LYRGIFTAIDEFTALRFTATGAQPAAKLTRNLPMTAFLTADNVWKEGK